LENRILAEDRMANSLCFNTRRRGHARLFGVAFYDLELTDRRLKTADRLKRGEHCLVATPTHDGKNVEFAWFDFLHQMDVRDPDNPTTNVRVLFGERTKIERLSRLNAIKKHPEFFKSDGTGSFKVGMTIMKG
jgi:hypothetical protein